MIIFTRCADILLDMFDARVATAIASYAIGRHCLSMDEEVAVVAGVRQGETQNTLELSLIYHICFSL